MGNSVRERSMELFLLDMMLATPIPTPTTTSPSHANFQKGLIWHSSRHTAVKFMLCSFGVQNYITKSFIYCDTPMSHNINTTNIQPFISFCQGVASAVGG